jgi:hypothetical protein
MTVPIWALAMPLAITASTPAEEPRARPAAMRPSGLVYATADAGLDKLGLQTLETRALIPRAVSGSDGGPAFSIGAGARVLAFSIGVRYRVARFSTYDFHTFGAETGVHVPAGRFEPYLVLGAGYAKLSTKPSENELGLDLTGLDVAAALGLDYYITRSLAIGAKLHGDALVFTRPGVDYERPPEEQVSECLQQPTTTAARQCVIGKVQAVDGSSLAAMGGFALGVAVRF